MPSRFRLLASVVVVASSLGGACYLITPYSDLTSGAHDGGPFVTDGAPGPEVGFCAEQLADASAGVFCDDFDGPPLSAKWDVVLVPPSSELRVDSSEFKSVPASLLLSVPDGESANQAIYLAKQFDRASLVTVAFDVRLDKVAASDTTYVVELAMGHDAVLLFVGLGSWTLQQAITASDGSATFPAQNLSRLPTPAWTHVELALSAVDRGASNAVVTVDGVAETFALDPSWTPAPFRLRVGATYVNVPTRARRVHFDNVRVEAR